MKTAVVIGGSNGIGLAIAKSLISKDYHLVILDKCEPDTSLKIGEYTFYKCDLLDFDEELIQKIASDENVEVLMITAGFGRVADFEYLHPAEIQNLLNVNTVAGIKIVRYFYDRIKSSEPFYCGMMGSVAGMMSSPMFSVYAASKAAICRFIESVNIELEVSGSPNRILNCSPGSVKGTKFNGKEQNISLVVDLADGIVEKLLGRSELYIPDIDVYGPVLERYRNDPHEYGLHSYNYKLNSGRAFNESRVVIGYLSGTFDLFHVGHLNLLQRAKQHCDYLIVGVHPSAAHKGKEAFIPFEERKRIVASVKYVDRVVDSTPEDCDSWALYHYNRLFVGSDYKGTERFNRYEEYFEDKGVEIVYFPYTQGTSSTHIRNMIDLHTVDKIEKQINDVDEQLKQIHRLELGIAEELKRICEKHNIKYFLISGTMLGAVRHGGFIPWDDDMDIGMMRDDYERFCEVCKSDLGGEFFLQTWDTDQSYPFAYAKIRLNGTHLVEEFSKDASAHNGIFIDIFPFDAVPEDENARKKQNVRFFICKRLLWIKKGMGTNMKKGLKQRIKYYLFLAFSKLFSYESIKKYFLKWQMKYNGQKTAYVTTDGSYGYAKESIKREWTEHLAPIKFEGVDFTGFNDKEEYLTAFYGDYMTPPPEDKRGGHMRLDVDFGPYADQEL